MTAASQESVPSAPGLYRAGESGGRCAGDTPQTARDGGAPWETDREWEAKEQAIAEAPVGSVVTDNTQADNPIVYANEAFTDTGYRNKEIVSRNCRFLQGEQTDPEPVRQLREAVLVLPFHPAESDKRCRPFCVRLVG